MDNETKLKLFTKLRWAECELQASRDDTCLAWSMYHRGIKETVELLGLKDEYEKFKVELDDN